VSSMPSFACAHDSVGVSRVPFVFHSMGDHDFVKPVLEELGTVQFGRVLMKPGKPLVFATIDTPKARAFHVSSAFIRALSLVNWFGCVLRCQGRKFAFGLPGNPVSSAVTFQLFVLPALKRLKGIEPPLCIRATVPCKLATALPMDPERPEYHRYSPHVTRVVVACVKRIPFSRNSRSFHVAVPLFIGMVTALWRVPLGHKDPLG
jgi:hypothetical protein